MDKLFSTVKRLRPRRHSGPSARSTALHGTSPTALIRLETTTSFPASVPSELLPMDWIRHQSAVQLHLAAAKIEAARASGVPRLFRRRGQVVRGLLLVGASRMALLRSRKLP